MSFIFQAHGIGPLVSGRDAGFDRAHQELISRRDPRRGQEGADSMRDFEVSKLQERTGRGTDHGNILEGDGVFADLQLMEFGNASPSRWHIPSLPSLTRACPAVGMDELNGR